MSKIFDVNWIQGVMLEYWKRCVVLVTDFARRYRTDLFLRTEINIILLQVAFAACILLLAIVALVVLYHDIVSGVGNAIATALTSTTTPPTGSEIMISLEKARTREILYMSAFIFAATALFGYLVARLALSPARNALAVQKQFIGNVAHEIRTPLSIIKTNTEVRLMDDIPAAGREVHLKNLEELDRISDIINNLLSLNTLVRPERIPFDNVDVGKLTRRVVYKLSYLAHKKSIRIKIRVGKRRTAWGNAIAIEQISANIIKNAIHYSLPDSEIVISIGLDTQGMVELKVKDMGAGIKREDLYHIFEPFYRGDRARTRSGGAGSGLGLAIVSELVKLHHGRVHIQSAPGQGTIVTVTLPQGKQEVREHTPSKRYGEVAADFSKQKQSADSPKLHT